MLSAGRSIAHDGNVAKVRLALRGNVLSPTAEGLVHHADGCVLADEAGRIDFAGSFRAARRRYGGPVQDLRPHLIVPGFVDAHVHFPQTRIIGRATGPLLDWLSESVFPEEARFGQRRYAEAVADEMIDRMLRAGTTSAAIFSSSSPRATDVLFERLAERGLRAVAGLTLMDARSPRALTLERRRAIRACEKLMRRWHGHDRDRLRFAVTPRFALSCSRAMLRDAGRLAQHNALPVQTHLGETLREGEETLRVHGYAEHYLDVYDQAGLVGERTILAHCIHLSRAEWNRVAQRGAHVAHCPDSNFFLGSGRMPLRQATRRGVSVALGSDVAAGRSFSMRRAMASAYDNALCLGHSLAPAELFRMATLGGARALGCADVAGSLEAGKDADIAVIGGMPRGDLDALLAALVFDSDDVSVVASYVRGKRLAPRSAAL